MVFRSDNVTKRSTLSPNSGTLAQYLTLWPSGCTAERSGASTTRMQMARVRYGRFTSTTFSKYGVKVYVT